MPFYPGINIATHIRETSGPTVLSIGAIALGQFLKRVAGDIVQGSSALSGDPIYIGTPDTLNCGKITMVGTRVVIYICTAEGPPPVYTELGSFDL